MKWLSTGLVAAAWLVGGTCAAAPAVDAARLSEHRTAAERGR